MKNDAVGNKMRKKFLWGKKMIPRRGGEEMIEMHNIYPWISTKKWYFDHNWWGGGVGHFVGGPTQKYHFFLRRPLSNINQTGQGYQIQISQDQIFG